MKTPLDLIDPRKPVQLTFAPGDDNFYPRVYALCDDGSIWCLPLKPGGDDTWQAVKPIPQKEFKPGEVYDGR